MTQDCYLSGVMERAVTLNEQIGPLNAYLNLNTVTTNENNDILLIMPCSMVLLYSCFLAQNSLVTKTTILKYLYGSGQVTGNPVYCNGEPG